MSTAASMSIAGPAVVRRAGLPAPGSGLAAPRPLAAAATRAGGPDPASGFADRLRHSVRAEAAAAGGAPAPVEPSPAALADRLRADVRGERPGPGQPAHRLDLGPADQAERLRASVRRARGDAEPAPRELAPATSAALEAARAEARGAAQEMVATLFVQPLLDAALDRAGDGPFAPGTGEKTFAPLLNQRLADEIVRGSDFALVEAVVDRLVPVAAPAVAAPTADPSTSAVAPAPTAPAVEATRSRRDG